jgi:hypothetical protein
MTLPEPTPARKPKRLGLYLPFAVAAVLALAWCAGWFWISAETGRRLDDARTNLDRAGVTLDWDRRAISGFPFRLDVTFDGLRVREPSGWALSAPRLKAEAYAYSPDHWVLVAPDSVTFVRPIGGPVKVSGKALRASVSGFTQHPPKVAVEGLDLTFQPAPGAKPFFVSAAHHLQFNLRAGPDDQGQIWFQLDGAQARLAGLFARVAGGKPVSLQTDAIFDHASSLTGERWPAIVSAWRGAGGTLRVRSLRVAAGDAVLDARTGALTVGSDGRLRGSLTANLRQAPRALAAMGQEGAIPADAAYSAAAVAAARSQGDVASMTIDFEAGQTTLGPVAIGPAPRVY